MFNKIQAQVSQALYTMYENVFLSALTGSGQFALLRLWSKREQARVVCIESYQDPVITKLRWLDDPPLPKSYTGQLLLSALSCRDGWSSRYLSAYSFSTFLTSRRSEALTLFQ